MFGLAFVAMRTASQIALGATFADAGQRGHHAVRMIQPLRGRDHPIRMMRPSFSDASLEPSVPCQRGECMLLAADYPFLDVLWTMLVFFLWVAWFIILFHVVADIFRRRDASGAKKTIWLLFVLFFPFVGVFAYLIANSDDMAMRNLEQARAAQSQMDDYVRSVAGSGGAAAEIEQAKKLLDSGAITQPEFEAIKAKALATT
jgi:phospholipase D-like protein/putative oligomerization/nucleic acid binding protein